MPQWDEIKQWPQKARNDLRWARILVEHDPPVLDMAAFHAQQAVEKALKSFMVWKAVRFEKVHSLAYLADLCEVQDPKFASLRDQVESLAPFAVEIRYPGDVLEISPEEALDALTSAEEVWGYVLRHLPTEFHASLTESS